MKKRLRPPVFLLAALLGGCLYPGVCAAQSPDEFVREFYSWYFTAAQGGGHAYSHDAIYTYVAKDAVSIARENKDGLDYFTKVGDVDFTIHDLTIQKIVKTSPELYIIHISFKRSTDQIHVVLFLQETGKKFLILRAVDIYPY
jgi:hypothetical protein